jgi:hypothetical protein
MQLAHTGRSVTQCEVGNHVQRAQADCIDGQTRALAGQARRKSVELAPRAWPEQRTDET